MATENVVKDKYDELKQAKTDLLAAIRAKGINVPTTTQYKDTPALVSSIEDVSTEVTVYTSLNDELASVIYGLPSAGGTSATMCTGTVISNAALNSDLVVHFVNSDFVTEVCTLDRMTVMMEGGTFTAAKGTIFTIAPWTDYEDDYSGVIKCFGNADGAAFIVEEDEFTLFRNGA